MVRLPEFLKIGRSIVCDKTIKVTKTTESDGQPRKSGNLSTMIMNFWNSVEHL